MHVAVEGLGEPYGGKLVDRLLPEDKAKARLEEVREIPSITPFVDFIYDAEKIGIGAYSPLEGFVNEKELQSVLTESRLPNGLPWTVPIILAVDEHDEVVRSSKEGDDIALRGVDGSTFALLHLEEKFRYDKDRLAEVTFGSNDAAHPNVSDIRTNWGSIALAGKIDLLRQHRTIGPYELTPRQSRELFRARGWKTIVGYQCRNPPHTAHEYLQRVALEDAGVDGLLIHPVVGRLKKGDYKPEVIMKAYQACIDNYYVPDRVALLSLCITMRYGGPKAALFLAIVRKNYGCTHYIVGRDQAGVGDYYDPYACHRIFDDFDVGIVPLRYMETYYCNRCGWMATPKTCPHPEEAHVSTSQTRIRKLLAEGKQPPVEILRPEVAEILKQGDVIIT
jgi:sulfate adenylyltransferase